MAESALKIPKFKIMGDALKVYNKVNGVAQEGATTQAAMMDFLQNNNDILRCFVEMLWQEACGSRTIDLVAIAAEWGHSKGYSGGYTRSR